MRIGWSYAPAEICDVLNRLRSPFAVSGPAQAAAAAAVEDQAFVAEGRRHNARWRAWLAQRLEGAGLKVGRSVCNFVLVHFPPDGPHAVEKADAHLKSQGIIARRVRAYGLPDALRITIGREDEVRAAAEALSTFMR
ncbi:MAG: aminotransferase class I/II-fold pyridoxal phosphate-dependent enzyme [Alphaproteobacteria bacterium]|nr:aminotransferase class I/II-fold pyridoxal phosphate-dependent enzyme [Alphaproteobacteria bacterium]